jgi:hypothetical protein
MVGRVSEDGRRTWGYCEVRKEGERLSKGNTFSVIFGFDYLSGSKKLSVDKKNGTGMPYSNQPPQ